ncbi:hypothetical protein [Streptomyces sp. NBC_01261]|uniref:hypothetical protein n=1 Tax=Streptomyces sp. NBC_01261 TaxID=2903802 RepID=UPI002E2F483B|nr:hypothetical protein [Streptomyces sp. NBC_01261]
MPQLTPVAGLRAILLDLALYSLFGSSRLLWMGAETDVEGDITALDAADELRHELTHRGVVFTLARVKQEVMADLTSYGLADSTGADLIFPTFPAAVAACRARCRDQ